MTPKKNPQTEENPAAVAASNWNFLFKWLFIIGGVTTGVLNSLAINPNFTIPDVIPWISFAIGVIVGIFYFSSDDFINIGLRFMIFSAVARALPGTSEAVSYIVAFFLGFSYYLGPIVLTVAIVYFVKKYILSK